MAFASKNGYTNSMKDSVPMDILSNALDACNNRRTKSTCINDALAQAGGAKTGLVGAPS